MSFKWETPEERLLRFMQIPAQKKLEWLFKMHKFMSKFSLPKINKIRRKLREIR